MNIVLRNMTVADLACGMRLKAAAGWNQTECDWRRFLDLEPDGCFAAEADGLPVGTAAAFTFGSVAWIAMVLVDPAFRGRGIGGQLVQHALNYLDRRGVPTVQLDATALGQPVYEKLGFRGQYEVVRLEGTAPQAKPAAGVAPAAAEDLAAIFRLDRLSSGADRRRLLRRLYDEEPAAMHVFRQGKRIVGYATSRCGSRAVQIGPAAARHPEAGVAVLHAAAGCRAGQPAFLDIAPQNRPAIAWAQSQGFTAQRSFLRMFRGSCPADQPTAMWASSGPEKG
jgi:GNAT superfamily N-acetyltransferase